MATLEPGAVSESVEGKASAAAALSRVLRASSRSRSRSSASGGLGSRLRRGPRSSSLGRSPSSDDAHGSGPLKRPRTDSAPSGIGGSASRAASDLPPEGTVIAPEGGGRCADEETEAAAAAACGWRPGDAVVLSGLKSRSELNGQRGTVVKVTVRDSGSARCLVEVPSISSAFSVKPENLARADAEGGTAFSSSTSTPSGWRPVSGADARHASAFAANFEKLQKMAQEVDRRSTRSKGRGKGEQEDPDKVLRQPLQFVRPQDESSGPTGKVVIVDPKGRGRGDGDSEDEDIPMRIKPPIPRVLWGGAVGVPVAAAASGAPAATVSSSGAAPAQPAAAVRAAASAVSAAGAGAGGSSTASAGASASAAGRPASAASAAAPAAPRPAAAASAPVFVAWAPPTAAVQDAKGNLTLTISKSAKQEDVAHRAAAAKKSLVQEQKQCILAKLTKQLQMCLARLQAGGLDEASLEKYQDMISSLKAQMAKITGIH
eukprot:CAMPEP_0203848178 /NCGR_PEP_ID=MMETSP0359-20131031/5419_1 /ASSEMBLY_ACC=CAM_ASM_000338 /TAXON_ID=268821 /ORGANISM="Scrippsiella Hangoei, Strain SHTV-5" /LENGTH=487 /DNA_ID=CAMNT_0050763735 /DNA_START=133 /DNA_END=1596 /DNA_ORIENTATION=-